MNSLPLQDEIISGWSRDTAGPLVSVCCTTYNHDQFIRDAIYGFLIQRTDFPFEILIHDDASTDQTAAVIREYESRYPLLIRGIYQTDNQYSKGVMPTTLVFPEARGKYIAFCEGDDFWTDPRKLQIQADYLEDHPEVVISEHGFVCVQEGGDRLFPHLKPFRTREGDLTGEQLILGQGRLQPLTWMLRNFILDEVPERKMVISGDRFLLSLLGHYGGSHYHDDIQPGCRRVHARGIWSGMSMTEKQEARINTRFWMYRYYARIGSEEYAVHYWHKFLNAVMERDKFMAKASAHSKRSGLRAVLRSIFFRCLTSVLRF